MLIEAMYALGHRLDNWILLIAGTDEFNHRAEIEALVRKFGMGQAVRFIGPLFNDRKRNAFDAADLFVLPTHSEGNPIVVLEALGAGVPVLTTKGAPWQDLVRNQCGWWTEISTDSIGNSLTIALSLPRQELLTAGLRGKDLVEKEYNWRRITQKTIQVYQWITGDGPKPDCVSE
jgi:glycosyltransferase involved in cell wall biosynthesis